MPQNPRETTPQKRPVVLYDGRCAFCRAGKERLVRLAAGRIDARDFQAEGVLDELPGIDHATAMRAMLLIDTRGRVYGGAEAIARALMLRAWMKPLAALYYVPGLRQLADFLYRRVAAVRYRLLGARVAREGCEGGACAVHFGEGASEAPSELDVRAAHRPGESRPS